jgi:hypothetical protein
MAPHPLPVAAMITDTDAHTDTDLDLGLLFPATQHDCPIYRFATFQERGARLCVYALMIRWWALTTDVTFDERSE